MNPIPLNDRGQYRYTDLVGYIPDFLKQEPDVVELLQIFSDYMNNAYRNIESVQKFEFKLCTSESRISKTRRRLGALQSMFEVASGRDDRIAILSVPRANVKSNSVFTKSVTPYVVEIGGDKVMDRISNATRYDANLSMMSDGDVVYVNYVDIDGTPTIGYYASVSEYGNCELIRDSMGCSQDPFTGTPNSTGRIVTFRVSDISSVHTRYGTTVNGCKYYEVFFSATVTDISDADAFTHRGLQDGKLAIDYYGMHSVQAQSMGVTQYYSSIGFANGDGWSWKSGYPTGIIYMLDSSTANLTTADYGSSDSMADPSEKPQVNRYIVDVSESGGQAIATSASMIPMTNGSIATCVSSRGDYLGRFHMESVDGNPKQVKLTAADGDSHVSTIVSAGRIVLVTGTLFYSRELGNLTGMAIIRMKGVENERGIGNTSRIYACGVNSSTTNLDAGSAKITYAGENRIHISGEACRYLVGDYNPKYLYCGDTMWNGVLTVAATDGIVRDDTGYIIKHEPISMNTRSAVNCELYLVRSGFITVMADGTPDFSAFVESFSESSMIVLDSVSGNSEYARQLYRYGETYAMDCTGITPGKYLATELRSSDANGVIGEIYRKTYDTSSREFSVVASMSSGDVYGGEFYLCVDDDGNYSVARNMNGISIYSNGTEYSAGDLVSYGGLVYRCNTDIKSDDAVPGISDLFSDVTVEYRYYSREYSVNDFMPYYGQFTSLEYDEKIDYEGIGDPSTFTMPLYICKAEDIRLKYGWEHREYLNHPLTMNRDTKARNGYVELYDSSCGLHDECFITEHDAVSFVPSKQVKWNIGYNVVKRGCESSSILTVNNVGSVSATRSGDEWVVTLKSSAHGLVDGCEICVRNFPTDKIDINASYAKVDVIDGDMFTYRVPADSSYIGSEVSISIPDDDPHHPENNVIVEYVGDYRYTITSEPTVEDDIYTFTVGRDAIGLVNGDSVTLENVFEGMKSVAATVANDTSADNSVVSVRLDLVGVQVPDVKITSESRIRGKITENDIVMIGKDMYRVSSETWSRVDPSNLILPVSLFAKDNLFDVTSNNPAAAKGPECIIKSIAMAPTESGASSHDTAIVTVESGFEHFADNGSIVDGHTMVYIRGVYPSEYCGWHLVKQVIGANKFSIHMQLKNYSCVSGVPLDGQTMTIAEGRWYRYTIDGMDWNRVSGKSTYMGGNDILSIENDRYTTRLPHGFTEGDRIVFANSDDFAKYDAYTEVTFCYGRVTTVHTDYRFSVAMEFGTPVVGMGVCRGIVLDGCMNNVESFDGEYTVPVYDENDKIKYNYRFMDSTIVVARGQYNPNERMVYVVKEHGYWVPMRSKRAMKISSISVDQYRSESYFDYYDPDEVSAYTFNTYTDVDVASFSGDYMVCGMRRTANVNFFAPALADMDSTQNMLTEYSSGEDYANVSPRAGMSADFKGVPDMKYPLAERIERLCYLRDMNVIDYDLIGYLARFMGYDLTSLSDDIVESPMYDTVRAREKAVRAAISSLPQYYSLGGTESGLRMLMDTFGVIGKAITLWTRADAPYDEMLSEDEVNDRVMSELSASSGSWVPTPYIDLELVHDDRFPQFECSGSDVERIKEQIRTFKPINVVFRDVVEKYIGTVVMNATMSGGLRTVQYDLGAMIYTSDDTEAPEIEYTIPDNKVTNCAF